MRNELLRVFGVVFFLCAAILILLFGCTLPKTVQFAPLVTVEANGSANGNQATVPLK